MKSLFTFKWSMALLLLVVAANICSGEITIDLPVPDNPVRIPTAEPMKPEPPVNTTPSKPMKPDPLRISLNLTDGSLVLGTPSASSFKFKTPFADMNVDLSVIRSIKIQDDHKNASVVMQNGDTITCALSFNSVTLQTIFGEHTVGIEHIQEIQVYLGVGATGAFRNGLVLHYSFDRKEPDKKVMDLSGKKNHGMAIGNASWSNEGVSGGAYKFNGVDGYINIADHPSLRMATNSFSISAWFKTSRSDTKHQGIFYKCNPTTPVSDKFYRLFMRGNGGYMEAGVDGDTASWKGWNPVKTSGDDYRDGKWHHVVFVRDRASDKLRIYEGGVEKASATDNTDGSIENTFDCSVGGNFHFKSNGDSQFFDGLIDEVRLYNKALTPTEIKQLHQSKR